jgi:hypothetical protein
LINLSALSRLVDATEDSAIQFFIVSFSSSKLKAFPFFFFLSFLDLDELEKNEEGVELLGDELWAVAREVDREWDATGAGAGGGISSSSSSKGFCSVSRRTFDLSCVTTCLRRGNS